MAVDTVNAEEASLEAITRHSPDAIVRIALDGLVTLWNPAAERLFGRSAADALGRRLALPSLEPAIALALAGEVVHGESGGLATTAAPIRADGGLVAGVCLLARGGAPAAPLDELSRRMAESLDLERAVGTLTDALVPERADAAAVYALDDGRLVPLPGAPGDPLPDVGEAPSLRTGLKPGDVPAFGPLGTHSLISVPLRSRGGVRGVVVLAAAGARPTLSPADLAHAQAVADRAAPALDNARLHAAAAALQARLAAAFEHAPTGMALVQAGGRGTIREINPALCEMLGYARAELVGRDVTDLLHPDDREAARESVAWLLDGDVDHYGGERRYLRRDGRAVWLQVRAALLENGGDRQIVLQAYDVTDRRRYEHQLQFLADHDTLTGLHNRRRFAEELEWVVSYVRRYRTPAAILVLDIDNFKFVNDTYGHATGDELLIAAGEVLRSRCRETDFVARLGGDEFGVLLPQSGREEAEALADSLVHAVREGPGVRVGTRAVHVTASVGVRLIEAHSASTTDELLSDADMALYDAKEGGRNRLSLAGDGTQVADRLRSHLGWSERIRAALESDDFVLYEQPILSLASDDLDSSELLIRMRGPDDELIAPGAFLDVAERFGQIRAIDCWVIGRAIRLLAERQAAGLDLGLEVNLSGASVTDASVIEFIASEVRNARIDPTRLVFEVTETAAIVNVEQARKLASGLSELGCRFALDDFGSGFGSFYYLKHLPFDMIKIDGDFIKDLPGSPTDQLTVQAIVQIARGMGKPTVAEFVDSSATLKLLRRFGVDRAQGYHVGRPGPVSVHPTWRT